MPPADPSPSQPVRTLGPFDTTCIVIGAIIGVGIFFNPSNVAGVVDSAGMALIAWAVAGAIAMCGALTFAELGGRYSGNGAQYEILRDSYGPCPAFLYVFCNATAIQAGAIGVIAAVCVKHIFSAMDLPEPDRWATLAGSCVLVVGLMGANIIGVRWGSRIQNLTVIAKIATLLAVTALAAMYQGSPPPPAEAPRVVHGMTGVLSALVFAFFAYGGWQHALWISGEVKEPRRNLPRAIIIGVSCVIVIYLLANWAYLRLLGHEGVMQSKTLAADAASRVLGANGGRIIAGAVALSAFGVLNAQLLSGPRLVYGMARDGRFFKPFARLHNRFGTPTASILLLGVTALVLVALAGVDAVAMLGTGAVFIDGIFFGLTGLALIILRRKGAPEGFRVPLYPLIPLLFVVGELGLLAGAILNPQTLLVSIIGVCWVIGAAVIYWLFFRRSKGALSESSPSTH